MSSLNQLPPPFDNPLLFTLIILWSLIWKGLALWHSARGRQTAWFVVLLVVNTIGLLEIIYLAFFRAPEAGRDKPQSDTHS